LFKIGIGVGPVCVSAQTLLEGFVGIESPIETVLLVAMYVNAGFLFTTYGEQGITVGFGGECSGD